MRRLAGTLQQHRVKLIQQLVEIDKHLASVRCRRASRFQVFKLRNLLAKNFDKSLGSGLNIKSIIARSFLHHRQASSLEHRTLK